MSFLHFLIGIGEIGIMGKMICPFDKKPCNGELGEGKCEIAYGSSSGKEVILFRCERFRKWLKSMGF